MARQKISLTIGTLSSSQTTNPSDPHPLEGDPGTEGNPNYVTDPGCPSQIALAFQACPTRGSHRVLDALGATGGSTSAAMNTTRLRAAIHHPAASIASTA